MDRLSPARIVPHREYYIKSGDVTFLVDNYIFRVHRYFFERESNYFRTLFRSPPRSVELTSSLTDMNAIPLHDVNSSEFSQFLWVFYNPVYSVYDAPAGDWMCILRLAYMWRFPGIQELCVRQLELQEVEPVTKISVYQDYEVDRALLLNSYVAICARPEPITFNEGLKMGMETSVLLATARERIRSARNNTKSPLSPLIKQDRLHAIVCDILEVESSSSLTSPTVRGSPDKGNEQLEGGLESNEKKPSEKIILRPDSIIIRQPEAEAPQKPSALTGKKKQAEPLQTKKGSLESSPPLERKSKEANMKTEKLVTKKNKNKPPQAGPSNLNETLRQAEPGSSGNPEGETKPLEEKEPPLNDQSSSKTEQTEQTPSVEVEQADRDSLQPESKRLDDSSRSSEPRQNESRLEPLHSDEMSNQKRLSDVPPPRQSQALDTTPVPDEHSTQTSRQSSEPANKSSDKPAFLKNKPRLSISTPGDETPFAQSKRAQPVNPPSAIPQSANLSPQLPVPLPGTRKLTEVETFKPCTPQPPPLRHRTTEKLLPESSDPIPSTSRSDGERPSSPSSTPKKSKHKKTSSILSLFSSSRSKADESPTFEGLELQKLPEHRKIGGWSMIRSPAESSAARAISASTPTVKQVALDDSKEEDQQAGDGVKDASFAVANEDKTAKKKKPKVEDEKKAKSEGGKKPKKPDEEKKHLKKAGEGSKEAAEKGEEDKVAEGLGLKIVENGAGVDATLESTTDDAQGAPPALHRPEVEENANATRNAIKAIQPPAAPRTLTEEKTGEEDKPASEVDESLGQTTAVPEEQWKDAPEDPFDSTADNSFSTAVPPEEFGFEPSQVDVDDRFAQSETSKTPRSFLAGLDGDESKDGVGEEKKKSPDLNLNGDAGPSHETLAKGDSRFPSEASSSLTNGPLPPADISATDTSVLPAESVTRALPPPETSGQTQVVHPEGDTENRTSIIENQLASEPAGDKEDKQDSAPLVPSKDTPTVVPEIVKEASSEKPSGGPSASNETQPADLPQEPTKVKVDQSSFSADQSKKPDGAEPSSAPPVNLVDVEPAGSEAKVGGDPPASTQSEPASAGEDPTLPDAKTVDSGTDKPAESESGVRGPDAGSTTNENATDAEQVEKRNDGPVVLNGAHEKEAGGEKPAESGDAGHDEPRVTALDEEGSSEPAQTNGQAESGDALAEKDKDEIKIMIPGTDGKDDATSPNPDALSPELRELKSGTSTGEGSTSKSKKKKKKKIVGDASKPTDSTAA